MKFIIETKSDKVLIEAEDRDHAFAKYFYDIINEKIPLDKIGQIIVMRGKREDRGDDIAFRTVPLLWKMRIIGTKHAIDFIVETVGVTRKIAKEMLKGAADDDARLVPLIDDLRLAEEGE